MVEPTETESREELDLFIDAMKSITRKRPKTLKYSSTRLILRKWAASTKSPPRASPCSDGDRSRRDSRDKERAETA